MIKKLILQIIVSIIVLHTNAQTIVDIPMDTTVKKGVLSNGLTYYIKKNTYKSKKADFYIVQKVGSMQEEDNQSGLAHFLEHMAFNGTKNYPGRKTMLDYLEKNGAKFGVNVNAYTSYDETVYNLSDIPLTRDGIMDSCLLILHDWSHFITLDNNEIDKERDIIKEEWRTRNNADQRIYAKLFPIMFEGSKYANRMPIGDMEIVENFPYQVIKDYYNKWYRPDLQAIIIVGDVDADKVEQRIKSMFADIPKPINPAERIYYPVKDNKERIVAVATDPEATSSSVSVYFKHNIIELGKRQQKDAIKKSILSNMGGQLLSDRYQEIARKSGAPFTGASAYDGQYSVSVTKNAFILAAGCKENQVITALTALLREKNRILKHGFIQSELDRYKLNMLQYYDQLYSNKDKQPNDGYVQAYIQNFIQNEPAMGIEYEYALIKDILNEIDLQSINSYMGSVLENDSENVVVTIEGPQRADILYPSKEQVNEVFASVRLSDIEPYSDTLESTSLIDVLPEAGKVVKVDKNGQFGSTVWKLSNGITIVLKHTDFKNDQIVMSGLSYGGTSMFEDNEVLEAGLINIVPSVGGVGAFSSSDLQKVLAGNSAQVAPSVSQWTQSFSGTSTKKDLETMLQLVYLYFTSPRRDNEAFTSFSERLKEQLRNNEMDPSAAFSDSVRTALYASSPRAKGLKYRDVDNLDYSRIIEMYQQSFAVPSSFTFVFVGTIDESVLQPLVEQYLGSLSSVAKSPDCCNLRYGMRKGEYSKHFNQTMETPMSSIMKIYSGMIGRNVKNSISLGILNQILDIVYTRTIREAEGGTYGVNTNISVNRVPDGETLLQITYTTEPGKVSALNAQIDKELKNIAEVGPSDTDFNKVKEYLLKNYDDQKKQNQYWVSHLLTYYFYSEDFSSDYYSTLENITPDDIKSIAKELLSQDNHIEVIMSPNEIISF
ncbi:pitrilysin family protein [Dysgonomonas sp. BGC7]|uniref:M16 family metallopeptidase n=1 Tax=Dysgonomonas sp. BGC7 TaxID=1658008 RepID=UPI000680ACDC|nr:M16 family metallopeptidase [Dysgonomonas sp. BGC7]MBD8387124.1 insulinase family protein [Dysgonomonas sp. BGC7]